jgi:hypothetical protein
MSDLCLLLKCISGLDHKFSGAVDTRRASETALKVPRASSNDVDAVLEGL